MSGTSGASGRPCPVCTGPEAQWKFERNGFDLYGCHRCGCIYVGQDTTEIDFASLYDEHYYTGGHESVFANYLGEEQLRRSQARRRLWWLRHMRPRWPRNGHLLDIGCAAGFFLAEARVYYEVQGVELSAWSSAHARQQLGLPVFTGTLEQAALPAAHFDIVTLWDVIEHVPDPVSLLAEAARLLRAGGRLVLTTGDWDSAYAQQQGAAWHLVAPPWHLTMFGRRTMALAGARAGLRVVHCASEGVAGDGVFWRHRGGRLLARLLDRGDVMRMTFTR